MNKYNVPKKEYENVKQEMNSFSGGGDSDDSAEYYKINSYNDFSNFEIVVNVVSLIHYVTKDDIECIAPLILSTTSSEPGIKIAYKISYTPVIFNSGILSISFEDTFYDVFYKNCKIVSNSLSDEEINMYFNLIFTPITKEEFYDLNNI